MPTSKIDPIENAVSKLPESLKKNLDKNLCVCNEVPKIKIITAIVNGANSITDIKKQTYATMGSACCKLQVQKLIDCLCVEEK